MPEMVALRASRFLPQARRIVGSGDENVSVLKTLYILGAHAQMNSTHATDPCAFQYIGPPHGNVCSPFWILTVVSILMASPFSDSIVFSVQTRKQRMAPFPVIVFGVVDRWKIALSGAKQLCFENGLVWTVPQCMSNVLNLSL